MRHILAITALSSFLSIGCGDRVTVLPGEVGKQIGAGGLEKELRKPGAYRLEWCGLGTACPKLARLTVALSAEEVQVKSVFLPKSNVDLSDVLVGIQFRIKPNEESYNRAFEEIISTNVEGSSVEKSITSTQIFNTYVKRKAPEAVIAALREYTVEQVLSEVDKIADFAQGKVNKALEDTPVEVTELGFPNGIGTPPQQVLEAKRKLYAINEEKAREIKSLEAAKEIENHRQTVQAIRVKNDAKNAKLAEVNYSAYVTLKNQERFADAAEVFADAARNGTPVGFGSAVPIGEIAKK